MITEIITENVNTNIERKKGKCFLAFIYEALEKTRPDTRLPKSRAGGQGPYLRSLDCLGRSSGVNKIKS